MTRRGALISAAGRRLSVAEPSGSTLLFTEDFSSGAFTQWASCQWTGRNDDCQTYNGTAEYSATVADEGTAGHSQAARFEVRDGDVPPFGGGERSEIGELPIGDFPSGAERWIAWDMKFPSSFPNPTAGSNWCIVWQLHGNVGGSSPPLCLDVQPDGTIVLAYEDTGGWTENLGAITKGVWQRWVVHTVLSSNAAVGLAEVWVDGVLKFSGHHNTFIAGDTGAYMKTGIYRDPVNTPTQIVWVDNIKVTSP